MSRFEKFFFPIQITKKICIFNFLLILIPIIALTVGLQLHSYEDEQRKSEATLRAVAKMLDEQLPGSFTDILIKNNGLNKPLPEKVLIINRELQPKINKMLLIFPDVGMGYYSLELDRRVAFGPRFTTSYLIAMPHNSMFNKIYVDAKPTVQIYQSSFMLGGKTALRYSLPIQRNGKVIGHIFTNMKLSGIYMALCKDILAFFLLGLVLLSVSAWFSRKLFNGIKGDLLRFSEALTSNDLSQLKDSLPELNPIIDLVQQHTGEKEKTIQKLVAEVKKRKSIQKKLSKANEKITTILDSINDAFFTLDNQWRFTYINDEARRLFTENCDGFKGKSIKEIPGFAQTLKNLRKSNSHRSKVCYEFFDEVLQRWFDVSAYLSENSLSVYLKDITPRKQADSKIAFQAAVMDQVRNIVIVTDLEGTITYWNKSAESACQWLDEEITGAENVDILVALESKHSHHEMRQTVLKDGHWEGELMLSCKDGSIIPFHLVSSAIKDTAGNTVGIVTVGVDISERKELEKEMIRLDRMDMVGVMAAGIGHEIRNPMTTVRGFLQVLSSKESDQEKLEYFELMIQELDRANSIISEYLTLAKNKRVTLKLQSLNSLISTLMPLLQAGAIVSDISLTTELEDIPDLLFDDKEIRQMLVNLVRNGIDSMSPGGVLTIRTYLDDRDVILEVADQGPGIDPKIIDRLGTPFVTSKDHGTGLGLAVIYSIANRHNAKVSFSTGPMGTTFYVRFVEAAKLSAINRAIQTAV